MINVTTGYIMNPEQYKKLGIELATQGHIVFNASGQSEISDKLIKGTPITDEEKKRYLILSCVAAELFLKAAFIKKGYLIFKINPLVKITSLKAFKKSWNMDRTIDVHVMVENLNVIFRENTGKSKIEKYRKVLQKMIDSRNKEVHYTGVGTFKNTFNEHMRTLDVLIGLMSKAV